MKRIVLTGGPGAGKSVIAAEVVRRHADRFALVPEAATQVYTMLNTRWDRLNLTQRRDAQRRIYHLQCEQEIRIASSHPNHHLLLDRGTIDGAAYWPDGPDDYWRDLDSSIQRELAKYDTVIWMESAAALGIYDGDKSNDVRFEDPQSAIESGKKLLKLWGGHGNLKHVGAFSNLADKIAAVEEQIFAEVRN
jgi:predicted ATPase